MMKQRDKKERLSTTLSKLSGRHCDIFHNTKFLKYFESFVDKSHDDVILYNYYAI